MLELWYRIVAALPFAWAQYDFMRNALLATLLITPVFAVMGTMVVSNRMVFFTDVIGHSALSGIAIGVILGIHDPTIPMIGLAVVLAIAVNVLKGMTHTSTDTVLGVLFAVVVSLGIVILSRQGGFVRYTSYLIGDILSVTPGQILWLGVIAVSVFIYWCLAGNAMLLTSINTSLARSRAMNTFLVETGFTVLLAVVVTVSIRLVGILIINSLLVLPAAASRNLSRSVHTYTAGAVVIGLVSGVTGLIVSYYWGSASGATIVLFAAACYIVSAFAGRWWKK